MMNDDNIDWCKVWSKKNIRIISQEDDRVSTIASDALDIISSSSAVFLFNLIQEVINSRCTDEAAVTARTSTSTTGTVTTSIRRDGKKKKQKKQKRTLQMKQIEITHHDINDIINNNDMYDFLRGSIDNIESFVPSTSTKISRKRQYKHYSEKDDDYDNVNDYDDEDSNQLRLLANDKKGRQQIKNRNDQSFLQSNLVNTNDGHRINYNDTETKTAQILLVSGMVDDKIIAKQQPTDIVADDDDYD